MRTSKKVIKNSEVPRPRVLPPKPEPEKKETTPIKKEKKVKLPKEPTEKKPRTRPTIEKHIAHYDDLVKLLDAEIDRRSRERDKGTRTFRAVRKTLIKMRKEIPYVARSKSARLLCSSRRDVKSGLLMQFEISDQLCDFLLVPHGTRLSRIEATRAICAYSHIRENESRPEMLVWSHLNPGGKRNLQNPRDKKSIIPDKALSKLLGYHKYKKSVAKGLVSKKIKNNETGETTMVPLTNDFLYYWVIQKLIGAHFLKDDAISEEKE